MKYETARLLCKAAEEFGCVPACTRVDSTDTGWIVEFPDLPTMLQSVASAAAELDRNLEYDDGSSVNNFIEDLALVKTWDDMREVENGWWLS